MEMNNINEIMTIFTKIKIKQIKQQGIRRHQTPPQYRNAASGSMLKVQPSTHRHTTYYGQT